MSTAGPVLGAKVRAPAVDGYWPARFDGLLERLARTGLLVVSAPAGSGKTTFLALASRRLGTETCWYRAEAADGDEAALAAHLQQALAPATAQALASPWTSVDDVVAALEDTPRRLLLTIDDADTLAGTPAGRALGRLATLRPPSVVLAIGARAELPFPLDSLRLANTVLEVGPDELRFRPWEVEALFHDHHRQPLRPDEAARLTASMGGWAAGLQLFHLATRGKSPQARRAVLERLPLRSPLVRDYLTRNVLAELPADLRAFLVASTPLGRLQPELCDAFLGGTGAEAHLRELARRGLFTSTDDGGHTYRYHEVLRAWLDAELVATLGADGAAQAHERAGRLLEDAGLVEDALRAYSRAGRWEAVERLVADAGAALAASTTDWLAVLPPSMREGDPWIVASRARLAMRQGRLVAAHVLFHQAGRAGTQVRPDSTWLAERRALQAWLEPAAPTAGDGWPALLRAATLGAPGAAATRLAALAEPASRVAAAAAFLLAGDLAAATRHANAAVRNPDASPEAAGAARALGALVAALAGEQEGPARVRAACADAADAGLVAAGDLLRLLGSPDAALSGDDASEGWWTALSGLVAGWLRLVQGGDARTPLLAAQVALGPLGAPVLEAWSTVGLAAAEGRVVPAASLRRPLGDEAGGLSAIGRRWSGARSGNEDHPAPLDAVSVGCLGPFLVQVGGTRLDLSPVRPRARQLLRFLAAHAPAPVHREAIIDALWPGTPATVGTHRLQVAVSSVRRLLNECSPGLGERLLRRTGEAYLLSDEATVDAVVARTAASEARRHERAGDHAAAVDASERVLACFRGDPLADDGAADWAVTARGPLVALATDAARRVAASALAAGRGDRAAAVCEMALGLEPYDDELWRLRIAGLADHGDHLAAAQARRRLAELLDDEQLG